MSNLPKAITPKVIVQIRRAEVSDVAAITTLFTQTILNINKWDYSPDQLAVWTSGAQDSEKWQQRILDQIFYITLSSDKITGFGSMTTDGYIDLMYVHHDHQRQGIARALLNTLEAEAASLNIGELISDVSITARPFFEYHGFAAVSEQEKHIGNVTLRNYRMTKSLTLRHGNGT